MLGRLKTALQTGPDHDDVEGLYQEIDSLSAENREKRSPELERRIRQLRHLAGIALTIALVVWLWSLSPVGVLLTLAALYGAASGLLYRRFAALQLNWKTFPATLDQLSKDRACLEKCLA